MKTHGMTDTAEWRIWRGIRRRCFDSSTKEYARYGGRGITMCSRWAENFESFYADMGPRPSSDHSIDRFPNNNGNYEPGNCRWATRKEQHRNKSNSRFVDINGESRTVPEWAEITGIPASRLYGRIQRGITGQRLLLPRYPSGEDSQFFHDITGKRFGRLVAIRHAGDIGGQRAWLFQCDCGKVKKMRSALVIGGTSTSCGCFRAQQLGNRSRKHGHCNGRSSSKEHLAWVRMKGRCYRSSHRDYHLAGGRGVTVCQQWLDSFENFLADMGQKPSPEHSLRLQEGASEYGPGTASWGIRERRRVNGRIVS